MKNIAEQIYQYRTKKGLSQLELAEMLEVSRQSVSKWETGTAIPELSKIVKLCEIFEVSLDEFVMGVKTEATPSAAPNIVIVQRPPISKNKLAGYLFLAIGLIFEFLLIFLWKSDLFSIILWAIPFTVCVVICLTERDKAYLWCIWMWSAFLWISAPLVFSISWIFAPIFPILVIVSVRAYRHQKISLSKKWFSLYMCGGVLCAILIPTIHFLTPYLQDAIFRMNIENSASGIMAIGAFVSMITPFLEIMLTAVFIVFFVPTFYTIKQKIEEKQ